MTIDISIIIPLYNAAKHLDRCVVSIQKQTFKNFELILVDDGSTDMSPNICDGYTNIDNRIKAIHLANGGVGNARNRGLSVARGKYVCFVDSDDYVKPTYLENLFSHIGDCDLIIASAIYERDGEKEFIPNEFISLKRQELSLLVDKDIITRKTFPWAKLFKKAIIDKYNLSFPSDMPIGEDAVFLFSYVSHCNNVKVVEECDYIYQLTNEGSLTKKRHPVKKEIEILNKIYSSTQELTEALCIHAPLGMINIKRIRQGYIRRVLDSIYFVENYSRKKRLTVMRELPYDDIINMPVYGSIRAKLLAVCLRMRLFGLYDLIRMIACKIRQ